MDLRRKKINQRKELLREISDLNYEIGFKMGLEEGKITSKYQMASQLLEKDLSINQVVKFTEITKEQIKRLTQII